jgi:beta propeller repeat protein
MMSAANRSLSLVALATLAALSQAGCRRVAVEEPAPPPQGTGGSAGAGGGVGGTGGGGLIDDIDQAGPGGGPDGGYATSTISDGGGAGAGGSGGSAPDLDGGSTSGDAAVAAPSLVKDVKVLAGGLTAIDPPAVGSDGVSLLHYPSTTQAVAVFADWNGATTQWYGAAGAYYLYRAASGTNHIALLYGQSYGIFSRGGTTELSGTPATYKEFLAASEAGFAWVDYEVPAPTMGGHAGMGGGGGRPLPPGPVTLGKITFQPWSGARAVLTDALRYRARIDLSRTHVAFVEYASATSVGQIVVQPLAGGAPVVAAPSTQHQDRPAIDGDWVVWEEYTGGTNSVIRGRHLVTGEVRALSSATGFRTSPDVVGARVVWEDQRGGNGDIYVTELGGAGGERIAVSGKGHSSAPRLTSDGLVWIESNNGLIGLVRARWIF